MWGKIDKRISLTQPNFTISLYTLTHRLARATKLTSIDTSSTCSIHHLRLAGANKWGLMWSCLPLSLSLACWYDSWKCEVIALKFNKCVREWEDGERSTSNSYQQKKTFEMSTNPRLAMRYRAHIHQSRERSLACNPRRKQNLLVFDFNFYHLSAGRIETFSLEPHRGW